MLAGIDPAPPLDHVLVVTTRSPEASTTLIEQMRLGPLRELGTIDGLDTAILFGSSVYFFFADRVGLESGACRVVGFDPNATTATGDFQD